MAYYGRRYSGGLQADPSFQLGMALGNAYGNMWAANAKKRQAKQLDDYIEEQRNADFMNEVNAMQTPVSGQERLINEARQVSNPSYDLSQGSTPILDRIDKYNQNGIDRAIDNIVKADSQGAINFMKKQEGMSELDREKQRYKNLDVDSVTAWAKNNGINQEVLDERLPALQKELASNIGGLMTKEITNNLYSGDMDKIITGIQQLDELEKYAPERAKELRRAGEAARVNTMNFNNQLKLANMRAGNKPVYRISDSAFNSANDAINNIRADITLNDEQKKQAIAPYQEIVNTWRLERGVGAVSGTTNSQNDEQLHFDPKDWENIKENINVAKDNGKGAEDIIAELVKNGVTGKELEQSYNYLGIESEEQKAKREEEKQRTLNWGGRGITNTVQAPTLGNTAQWAKDNNRPIF